MPWGRIHLFLPHILLALCFCLCSGTWTVCRFSSNIRAWLAETLLAETPLEDWLSSGFGSPEVPEPGQQTLNSHMLKCVLGFTSLHQPESNCLTNVPSANYQISANGVAWVVCALSCFSLVLFFVTLWTVGHQAPLSMGFLQARILEWVAMPSSGGIFSTQGSNLGLPHYRQILYCLSQLTGQMSPVSLQSRDSEEAKAVCIHMVY